MRLSPIPKTLLLTVAALVLGGTPSAAQQGASGLSRADIVAFAKVSLAVSQLRDSLQKELAAPRNKTPQAQQQLHEQLSAGVAAVLKRAGISDAEFSHKTYVISTDSASRAVFDEAMSNLTGAPLPGQLAVVVPAVPVPPGPVGEHIGHVLNAFSDTPRGMGLLRTAMEEARTAAVHAGFAARDPENLANMKTHAAHVINAVDPTVMPTGPGLGYGVKRAALGVATHVDMAAKVPGASDNVVMHAGHAATSARNTVRRADEIVALAQQVRAATTAAEAAGLVSQLVSLTSELVIGKDADADGKITWKDGEGGLAQCEQHLMLLLNGEKPGGQR